ncbi:hypothetical protein BSKO_10185 [Bryopsis sp. KO-2023]|nr:hypothetical protein BSKO_10185 [Bryopsis sp. KO-2023]
MAKSIDLGLERAFPPDGGKTEYYKEEENFWLTRAAKVDALKNWCDRRGDASTSGTCARRPQSSGDIRTSPCLERSSLLLDAFLLPGTGSFLQQPSPKHLELHRRVVELASLRASILDEKKKLEARKNGLCQEKLVQQARLVSKLNARLHGVIAEVDNHYAGLDARLREIESYSSKCARILQGVMPELSGESWEALDVQFIRLTKFAPEVESGVDLDWLEQAFLLGAVEGDENDGKRMGTRVKELEEEVTLLKKDKQLLEEQLEESTRMMVEVEKERDGFHAALKESRKAASQGGDLMSEQRSKYQKAIEQIEAQHQSEVERLESMLKEQCSMEADKKSATKDVGFEMSPCEQLRRAMQTSPSRLPKSDANRSQEARLRESYQKMIMEMQSRFQKDKEKLSWERQKEIDALREAHQESLETLASQLNTNRGGDQESRTVLEAELKLLREDNKKLKADLEHLVEEFESRKEYALYTQRCEHEKDIIRLKDSHKDACEKSKTEVEEMQSSLNAMHHSGALSPSKVRHVVEDALRVKDAEYRAHAISAEEQWKERLENIQTEYKTALGEREREYDALMKELHFLRSNRTTSSDAPASDGSCDQTPAPPPPAPISITDFPSQPRHPRKESPSGMQANADKEQDMEVEVTSHRGSDAQSNVSAMVNAVLGERRAPVQAPPQPTPSSPPQKSSASACIRCGSRESAGPCRFHPALLRSPGPLLFSPEWHACKAAGHSRDQPGCYVRKEHYRPTPIDPRYSPKRASVSFSPSPPRPRSQHPVPSRLRE